MMVLPTASPWPNGREPVVRWGCPLAPSRRSTAAVAVAVLSTLVAGAAAAAGWGIESLAAVTAAGLLLAGASMPMPTLRATLLAVLLLTPDIPSGQSLGLLVHWSHGLTLTNFLIPALAVPLLFGAWLAGRRLTPEAWPGLARGYFVLLGWAVLTLLVPAAAGKLGLEAAATLFAHLAKIAFFLWLGVVLCGGRSGQLGHAAGEDERHLLQNILLIGIVVNAGFGLGQVAGWLPTFSPLASAGASARATGLFFDANMYAVLMAWALLWLLCEPPTLAAASTSWRHDARSRARQLTGAGPRSAAPSDPLTLGRAGSRGPARPESRLFACRGRAALRNFAAFSRPLCPRCKRRDPRVWSRRGLALAVAANLIAAGSRAGYLALAAGCLFLLLRRQWRPVLGCLLLLGLLAAMFPVRSWQRLRAAALTVRTELQTPVVAGSLTADTSTQARFDSMRQAERQIVAHPVLGSGFGRALYLGLPGLTPTPVEAPDTGFHGAQNMYLTVLAAMGPVGLALLLLALAAPLRQPWQVSELAIPAGFIGVLAASCTLELLWNTRILALLVLLTAGAFAAASPPPTTISDPEVSG